MSALFINSVKTFVNNSRVCTISLASLKNAHSYLPLASVNNTRNYAAPAAAGGGKKSKVSSSGGRKKEFPVETDPHRLVNYCCGSNYFIEGEDVKLKPESEYPDWLWNLNTGPQIPLEELDPNSKEYWIRVRTLARRRINKIHRLRTRVLRRFG